MQVQDWPSLINVLLDKMYAEASNPVIPRFLSHISIQLSDMAPVVFPHVYQRMHEQPKWDTFSWTMLYVCSVHGWIDLNNIHSFHFIEHEKPIQISISHSSLFLVIDKDF